jgi:hypothetical protein
MFNSGLFGRPIVSAQPAAAEPPHRETDSPHPPAPQSQPLSQDATQLRRRRTIAVDGGSRRCVTGSLGQDSTQRAATPSNRGRSEPYPSGSLRGDRTAHAARTACLACRRIGRACVRRRGSRGRGIVPSTRSQVNGSRPWANPIEAGKLRKARKSVKVSYPESRSSATRRFRSPSSPGRRTRGHCSVSQRSVTSSSSKKKLNGAIATALTLPDDVTIKSRPHRVQCLWST